MQEAVLNKEVPRACTSERSATILIDFYFTDPPEANRCLWKGVSSAMHTHASGHAIVGAMDSACSSSLVQVHVRNTLRRNLRRQRVSIAVWLALTPL